MTSRGTLITDEIVEKACIAMHSAYAWNHFAPGLKEMNRDAMRRTPSRRSSATSQKQDTSAGVGMTERTGETAVSYDSRPDTHEHIARVRGLVLGCAVNLIGRAHRHDASKLESPEVEVFDKYTPMLRDSTYGSAEYQSYLKGMGEGLKHHYANNRHHPEHFHEGIGEMNLLDLVEMLADWKAATERHADGDLERSITQNAERFGYGPELTRLFRKTAQDLGWLKPEANTHTFDLQGAV